MTEEITPLTQPRRRGRRTPVYVMLAGGNEGQRTALQEVLGKINELEIHCINAPGKEGAANVLILMAILDERNQDGWRHELRSQNAAGQYTFVIALVSNPSHATLRAALRAGADDVLEMPPDPERLFHSLFRVSVLSHRKEGLQDKMVCSLVSVSGGVGVSHLSINLGLAMHRLFAKRTVILELDLQAAPLAVLLNAEPEHTISELADPTSAVDSIRLESVLCKHESGIYWLAAPRRIEEAELVSAATVEATLKVLRELFDVVLIDCGTSIVESSVACWELSDHLIYVIDQTVTAIRAAQRFLELYERLGLKHIEPSFVLNRYVAANAVTLAHIEAALRRSIFMTLPRDDRSFKEQQLTGQDFWKIASAAGVRESVERLARKLYEDDTETAPAPGLFNKLLAGLGLVRERKNGID